MAPYKCLDMRDIAAAFEISLEQVEKELTAQISAGNIKAKIDSHKKLLFSRQVNTELDTYKKVDRAGDKFIHDTEMALMKIACIRKDIVLQKHG